MHNSAVNEPYDGTNMWRIKLKRVADIAIIAIIISGTLQKQSIASAQACNIPPLDDNVCAGATSASIDEYKSCYSDLYDFNVIPVFQAMAQCSHAKADSGIRSVLEDVAALTTGAVKQSLDTIDRSLTDQSGSPSTCIGDLNAVADTLSPYIDAERSAPDLDTYRRSHYTPAHMKFFQDLVLTARQNRAVCDATLQSIRKSLLLLADLKVKRYDYCDLLHRNLKYEEVSRIEKLPDWTSVDPNIHFDDYFDVVVTLNSQCGYYDFSNNGAASLHDTTCATLTTEYKQTLANMDGTLGWIADHRALIVTTSTAVATTLLAMAGYGSAAGPYGALVGAAVGLIIAGLEYLGLEDAIDDLNRLIAEKQQELKDVVAANLITEDEFGDRITALCTPWQHTIDTRVQQMLKDFDAPTHLLAIATYFTTSDSVTDWYNELFIWASAPGPDGQTFLDVLARQDLLAQKDAFDQRIFSARADQEVATQKNALSNIKGTVTQLGCASLSPPQTRGVKARMNAGIGAFNRTCLQTMDAIAVRTGAPIPFADGTVESDVLCAYRGFLNDVVKLEVTDGSEFSANLTMRDSSGAAVGAASNVTSDTDFGQLAVPGLECVSATARPFGKDAASRLVAGVYTLAIQDNILGFDASDAAALRPAIQTLDSQLRLKESTCARQLGFPVTIPRPASACGIPVVP